MDRRGDMGLRQRLPTSESAHRASLRWLVDGARRWYEAGRVMPEKPAAVEQDALEWRKEADLVLAYIDDRLIFKQGHVIPAADLPAGFSTWMEQRGQRAWTDRTFVQRVKDREVVTGARDEYDRVRQGQCETLPQPRASHRREAHRRAVSPVDRGAIRRRGRGRDGWDA